LTEPRHIAFLVWAATPEHPELFVTPLVHALAARALDCEVEIHFAGPAVRWLVSGVADAAYATPAHEKSILAWLRQVTATDVPLFACSMACAAWIKKEETLIPEFTGAAGATAFVARTLDPEWRTVIF
jgi:predicted peroxiredoxin